MTLHADDHDLAAQLTALTRDLILIPSTASRPDERERCVQFIHNHLDGLADVRTRRYDSQGYASLVATPVGVDVPDILLSGHLDVIEHPDRATYNSAVRDGRIYGPGAADMKGSLAILLDLFHHLHQLAPGLSLGLAITSDEERGGADGVRYLFEDVGLRCGLAIVPDGGSLNELTVEEKGVLHLRVRYSGHAAHAARPWLGDNALETLVARLGDLRRHFDGYAPSSGSQGRGTIEDHWYPTCSVTVIDTLNETANRIPSDAGAVIDVRFTSPHSAQTMLDEIADVLGPACVIEPMMTAEPTHLDPDDLFCAVTERITGNPVHRGKAAGGSDARFLRPYGIPVNLSRPIVGNLHTEDEWIDIDSMVTYYRICERYICEKLQV